MILQNKFYEISEINQINETQVDVDIQFNTDHIIFEVHFPNQPIVPGACLVQISKEILESILKTEISITNCKNLKFIKTINPNEYSKVQLSLKIIKTENEQNVQVGYTFNNITFCKLYYTFIFSNG